MHCSRLRVRGCCVVFRGAESAGLVRACACVACYCPVSRLPFIGLLGLCLQGWVYAAFSVKRKEGASEGQQGHCTTPPCCAGGSGRCIPPPPLSNTDWLTRDPPTPLFRALRLFLARLRQDSLFCLLCAKSACRCLKMPLNGIRCWRLVVRSLFNAPAVLFAFCSPLIAGGLPCVRVLPACVHCTLAA